MTRIKAARTIGARGVETISAIALVHIQPVTGFEDVLEAVTAAAGEGAVLRARDAERQAAL